MMSIIETISDLLARAPRDASDGPYRAWAHGSWTRCAIIGIVLLLVGAWFASAILIPDLPSRIYAKPGVRPVSPEDEELGHLRDLAAKGRRSGGKSSAARAAQTVLYKRIHRLEIEKGQDPVR